jgi:hypothetical protein
VLPSARSLDRPTAVDLEEIAVASGLELIGLLGRKVAAFVFDNEGSLLDRRCRKETLAAPRRPRAERSTSAFCSIWHENKLPSAYTFREHVEAGGLLAYSPNYHDLFFLSRRRTRVIVKPGSFLGELGHVHDATQRCRHQF